MDIQEILTKQKQASRKIGHKGLQKRLYLLSQLKKLIQENQTQWLKALYQDLGKAEMEAYTSEIGLLLNEIDFVTKHLKTWLEPKVKTRRLVTGLEKILIYPEPHGSVLVIGPYNYPLQLALMPVIGAFSGGNSVVLKPSEDARQIDSLLNELVPQYFTEAELKVVSGDGSVGAALTQLPFDFIFFTGSKKTGQAVYQAASKHMAPVLLELSGKNPAIFSSSGFTKDNVKELVWGKFFNTGQTCIAPDTAYVPFDFKDLFIRECIATIQDFYSQTPQSSSALGRIINEREFDRITNYLKGRQVLYGGHYSRKHRYIEPTILLVDQKDELQNEEIFGPILPIIIYQDFDKLLNELSHQPVPLATYLFSESEAEQNQVMNQLEAGTIAFNKTIIHASSPHLPFGGKGSSGIGRYHGKTSFDTFTYPKSLYQKASKFNKVQYPPYSPKNNKLLKTFRKLLF